MTGPRLPIAAFAVTLALGAGGFAARTAVAAPADAVTGASALAWRGATVGATANDEEDGRRRYHLTVHRPSGFSDRTLIEPRGAPRLRTGSTLLDALFALAVSEASLDAVEEIRDAAFDDGKPMPCRCYETGERWHYVWTRDVSYATDLGLDVLDPRRALNSLLFKTSGVRTELLSGFDRPLTLVAQDTGSGGSWPVSTDRVVWVLAATDALEQVEAPARAALAAHLYAIARDTLEQDRRLAFDPSQGLYRGETSFLDWREQTYPAWTREDVLAIAGGYALSTNVLEAAALERAARLAAGRDAAAAARYRAWALALKRRIDERFWRADAQLYASYLTPAPNAVPAPVYDLLGESLAILHGVASAARARTVLAHYPLVAAGAPVVWPERTDVAVYHNRAQWPFVTAYALAAARRAGNAELAGRFADALLRGAGLSLSNMENFEFTTLSPRFEDGPRTGPVIDSPRQLWSVAGFVGMVAHSLWGLGLEDQRLRVAPRLPARFAHEWFAAGASLTLEGMRFEGRAVDVVLHLPAAWPASGWLQSAAVSVDGHRVGGPIDLRALAGTRTHRIDVRLAARSASDDTVRLLADEDRDLLYAPPAPELVAVTRDAHGVVLRFHSAEPAASAEIFRNGARVASGLGAQVYRDDAPPAGLACYSVSVRRPHGLESSPSRTECAAAPGGALELAVGTPAVRATPAASIDTHEGLPHLADWGAPEDRLTIRFRAPAAGLQRLRLRFANHHGPINTGVTAAVKQVEAHCAGEPAPAVGTLVMPHNAESTAWALSTDFVFRAREGAPCEVTVSDGFNMSYLSVFEHYTAGEGGREGAVNRADIAGARIEVLP